MVEVSSGLRQEQGLETLEVVLTDLYPNHSAAAEIEALGLPHLRCEEESVDATRVPEHLEGVRTMICSMHHMPPPVAKEILSDAFAKRQPICIFEISDNGPPVWLFWLAMPFGFLMTLLLTPRVRPLTAHQLIFTYLIPILPLLIAWDGAVSNARTYTEEDLRLLITAVEYWEDSLEIVGIRRCRHPGEKVYLLGLPEQGAEAAAN